MPDPPVLLSADSSTGVVVLTWSPPADDGGSPITGYNVYRGTAGSGSETLLISLEVRTDYVDEGVSSEFGYHYVVTVVNDVGESAWSNEYLVSPS
ncbi:MAG TPA: fibronectin type III domain-containing protein [Actinomycetota bacterium]